MGYLLVCFGLSSSNVALADQIVNVPPIIVQPEDLQEISQQMLAQDRINRDQELAIRGLIDDNQKLTDTALARQQDSTLEKINQTMKNYRDALLSRDKARIAANAEIVSPRYRDLVYLTENVDDMKGIGQTLEQKSNVIEEKYKILTDLKDELTALNEKLKGEAVNENFSKTPPQQGDKIQVLTWRLGEMDQKIAHFDQILAAKDQQISQLKNSLAKAESDIVSKEDKIRWLNQVLAVAKNKAEYYKLTSQQKQKTIYLHNAPSRPDDRVRLAKQLISLQQQQLALLEEKNKLWGAQNALYDQHIQDLENKLKGLSANHQNWAVDLKNELSQKEQQVELLKSELENNITEDRDKDNQIASLRTKIRSGQVGGVSTDTLKQQLAEQQNKEDLLKQELENKISESNKMTLMMSDYQKKLEAKDNAYNDQLGQIADLNARLQIKEAQAVKIKKEINEDQSQELSLSMVQQKAMDDKVKEYQDQIRSLKAELALEHQELEGMPSSDEISFLRKGLAKATAQIKQKDEMLTQVKANADKYENDYKLQSLDYQNLKGQLQSTYAEINRDNKDLNAKDLEITRLKERYAIEAGGVRPEDAALQAQLKQKDQMLAQVKANADEYERKYKEQSREFQSLKDQLQDAYDEIGRKNEDLKYKNMEITRLKERSPMSKTSVGKIPGGKEEDLQAQLKIADAQIKDLKAQLKELNIPSKGDVIQQKLKQALDEIDEQGRVINILVQKLQDAGQSVDLKQYLGKQT
jgi:chromosome segregation ATPase